MTVASAVAAAAPTPVKALDFATHFRRLFAGRPVSTSSSSTTASNENWAVLDGIRAILCIWMVAFHSLFYCLSFIRDEDLKTVIRSPYLLLLNLGFLPVDGFFILTGLLIAYPLFKEEYKRAKVLREQEKDRIATNETASLNSTNGVVSDTAVASPYSFDLRTFYYRRVTRMLPSYLLAIIFYTVILFPNNVFHSFDVIYSQRMFSFFARVLPDATSVPTNATPFAVMDLLTWVNHLTPFGGCMGWTWTFALQFNFYLFFPALWKYANDKCTKEMATKSGKDVRAGTRTPSSIVLPVLFTFLALNLIARVLSFLQLRTLDMQHAEAAYLGFFWYSNTITRGGAIVWGVLTAYALIHCNFASAVRRRTGLVSVGWIVVALVVTAQMCWNRYFADGNMVEAPGESAVKLTQQLGGAESWKSMNILNANIIAYWWHAIFHVFALVGSPLSSFIFSFVVVVTMNGIGPLGAFLQRLLSHRAWYTVSALSWWVYLLHPSLMSKSYILYCTHIGELPATVAAVFGNAVIQLVLSFTSATIMYVLVEAPLEIALRGGEEKDAKAIKDIELKKVKQSSSTDAQSSSSSSSVAASPSSSSPSLFARLKSIIYYYCCSCMVWITLYHLVWYLIVATQLIYKPYVDVPSPYTVPPRQV